jgi:hypothetical protein
MYVVCICMYYVGMYVCMHACMHVYTYFFLLTTEICKLYVFKNGKLFLPLSQLRHSLRKGSLCQESVLSAYLGSSQQKKLSKKRRLPIQSET